MATKDKTIIVPLLFKNNSGGAVKSTLKVINKLSLSFNIIIITVGDINEEFSKSINNYNVKKMCSIKGNIKFYKLLNPFALIEIFLFLKKMSKEDIILSNDFSGEFLLGLTSSQRRIYVARGGNFSTVTGFILRKIILPTTKHFIAVSETEKEKLIKIGIHSNLISIIYNSITPSPLVHTNTNNFTVACIGYYDDNKNQILAFKVAKILKEKGIKIKFNFYGDFEISDKNYLKKLYNFIKMNNLEDYISIYDYVPNIEIYNSNYFLISVSKDEGFGNTLLEAMAYRRPIIATLSGGLSKLLRNRENAIIVEDYCENRIAQVFQELIKDNNLCSSLTDNAYNFYMGNFQDEVQISKYKEIIDNLKFN